MEICYKNESKFKWTHCLCFVFRLIWAWHEIKPYDWICSNFKELWYYRLWRKKLKCSSICSISSCWYSASTLVVNIGLILNAYPSKFHSVPNLYWPVFCTSNDSPHFNTHESMPDIVTELLYLILLLGICSVPVVICSHLPLFHRYISNKW